MEEDAVLSNRGSKSSSSSSSGGGGGSSSSSSSSSSSRSSSIVSYLEEKVFDLTGDSGVVEITEPATASTSSPRTHLPEDW